VNHGLPGGIGGGGNRLQSTTGSFRIAPDVVCVNVPATVYDQSYATMFPGADDVRASNVQLRMWPSLDISQVSDSVGPVTPKLAVATVGLVTDNPADADTPPYDAVIVPAIVPPTALVVAVNVALVDPAATVALVGTTIGSALDSVTTAPPAGAADVSVTVPVTVFPPTTVDVFNAIDASATRAVTVNVAD
jgi:hypothetical protein